MFASVPSDHDDHPGRAVCWRAAGVRRRYRLRVAAASRHRHCRWITCQPTSHALYDACDLSRVRSFSVAHEVMSLSSPFIHRPTATTLLTIAVAVAGALAYVLLPVSPLPQVEFPTIQVSAG